jgi:steroid 5-alpha reductase family enzyme
VFLVGIFFDWLGDWQLAQFKGNPANEGKILDSGLWRYTRHPNYFGDCAAWWGIWLATAGAGWNYALLTLPGPLFLTFTLTKWSGAALLEAGMKKKRGDKYADYIARTSSFFPWPPKRR